MRVLAISNSTAVLAAVKPLLGTYTGKEKGGKREIDKKHGLGKPGHTRWWERNLVASADFCIPVTTGDQPKLLRTKRRSKTPGGKNRTRGK